MKKRTIFITCGIVLACIAAILTGGSLYMLNFSLRPDNRGKDMARWNICAIPIRR